MATTRTKIVKQAQSWIGCKESNGTHKPIIDTYNAHKPLARGYKVKYTDAWCATFASACAIKCGATDIIPTECSCRLMIDLFKSLGSWKETDSYKPQPGDFIFYDWDDTGKGEDTGNPEHVGIVESVSNNTIIVIEGNYSNAVKRRTMTVNGRYIRGYGIPKYTAEKVEPTTVKVELAVLKRGSKGEQVKTLQRLLNANSCSVGSSGIDGSFGPATEAALKKYQGKKGLPQNGICDAATWNKILKG